MPVKTKTQREQIFRELTFTTRDERKGNALYFLWIDSTGDVPQNLFFSSFSQRRSDERPFLNYPLALSSSCLLLSVQDVLENEGEMKRRPILVRHLLWLWSISHAPPSCASVVKIGNIRFTHRCTGKNACWVFPESNDRSVRPHRGPLGQHFTESFSSQRRARLQYKIMGRTCEEPFKDLIAIHRDRLTANLNIRSDIARVLSFVVNSVNYGVSIDRSWNFNLSTAESTEELFTTDSSV